MIFHADFRAENPESLGIQPSNDFLFGDIYMYIRFCHVHTPTQNFKIGCLTFSSQEIGSSLVCFGMIFEALPSIRIANQNKALFAEFKIPKIPEINLDMDNFRV